VARKSSNGEIQIISKIHFSLVTSKMTNPITKYNGHQGKMVEVTQGEKGLRGNYLKKNKQTIYIYEPTLKEVFAADADLAAVAPLPGAKMDKSRANEFDVSEYKKFPDEAPDNNPVTNDDFNDANIFSADPFASDSDDSVEVPYDCGAQRQRCDAQTPQDPQVPRPDVAIQNTQEMAAEVANLRGAVQELRGETDSLRGRVESADEKLEIGEARMRDFVENKYDFGVSKMQKIIEEKVQKIIAEKVQKMVDEKVQKIVEELRKDPAKTPHQYAPRAQQVLHKTEPKLPEIRGENIKLVRKVPKMARGSWQSIGFGKTELSRSQK